MTRASPLPGSSLYADVYVRPRDGSPYVLEVGFGLPSDRVARQIRSKYGVGTSPIDDETRLVLVLDVERRSDGKELIEGIRRDLRPGLHLDLWDETRLATLLGELLGVTPGSIIGADPHELREAVDRATWRYAFGSDHSDSALRPLLLWHFGFWRLRELYELEKRDPESIIAPGAYPRVTVLTCDISGFTSYVRDTPHQEVVSDSMTAYYSTARHQILDAGGMLLEFVGDNVVGLFGVPDPQPGQAERALDCALGLVHVGNAVMDEWQSRIDRAQASRGVTIGVAVGEMSILAHRAFSRVRIGALGDAHNLASRLRAAAEPGEVIVSNTVYRDLPEAARARLHEVQPVAAKNMGLIKAWRASPP